MNELSSPAPQGIPPSDEVVRHQMTTEAANSLVPVVPPSAEVALYDAKMQLGEADAMDEAVRVAKASVDLAADGQFTPPAVEMTTNRGGTPGSVLAYQKPTEPNDSGSMSLKVPVSH